MDDIKGSFEKMSNGSYRLRYPIGTTANGNSKRLSRVVKVKTDKAAFKELMKWNIEIDEHGYNELDDITFKNFYTEYWIKAAKENLEIRTFESYNSIIQDRFLNIFGNKKVKEIKPFEIKEVIINAKRLTAIEKYGPELSRQTKKRLLSAISNFYNIARDEYRIVQDNPCNQVRIPKEKNVKKNVCEPYNSEEIKQLFKALEEAPLRTKFIIMTAFFTAARQGEIAALEEKHFNFKTNEVLFEQRIIQMRDYTLVRVDGLKSTDNKVLSVPESYMDIAQAFIQENKKARQELNIDDVEHCYVLGSIDGKPVAPSSLNRNWVRFAQKNNLRKIRFHDFRHTSATFLIAQNTPLKAVQERLGHKDYNTTINTYAHLLKETDRKASNTLSQFFN